MIVLVLLSILTGSFGTVIFLLIQGSGYGMALLGYLAGGWAGLVIAVALILVARGIRRSGNRDRAVSASSSIEAETSRAAPAAG